MSEPTVKRRPVAPRDARQSPAPEKVDDGARTRDFERLTGADAAVAAVNEDADDDRGTDPDDGEDERANRERPRVRQVTGGEVHFFAGAGLVRETR